VGSWAGHAQVGASRVPAAPVLRAPRPSRAPGRHSDSDSNEARVLRPLQAAACTYRIAFGPRAGQKVLTVQGAMPRDADFKQTQCADIDGFSLHAAVRCGAVTNWCPFCRATARSLGGYSVRSA